jgi:hypothetical protein
MTKHKLLAGLLTAVALLATAATPASATFKSLILNHESLKVGAITFVAGGATIKCEGASGEWRLRTGGKFEEAGKENNQIPTLNGPHLYVAISEWHNCMMEALKLKLGAATEACELQVVQTEKGATKGTVTMITPCSFKAPLIPCTVTLSAGKEATGINNGLNEFLLENSKANGTLLMTPRVSGIQGTTSCDKPEAFTNGKLEGATGSIVTEGGVKLS